MLYKKLVQGVVIGGQRVFGKSVRCPFSDAPLHGFARCQVYNDSNG